MDLLSRLVTPTGTKGCAKHVALAAPFVPVRGQKGAFCPGCQTRDKRAPPFVPAWRSRLGNRDKKGFPTGTTLMFCSSVPCFKFSKRRNKIIPYFLETNSFLMAFFKSFQFLTRHFCGYCFHQSRA